MSWPMGLYRHQVLGQLITNRVERRFRQGDVVLLTQVLDALDRSMAIEGDKGDGGGKDASQALVMEK